MSENRRNDVAVVGSPSTNTELTVDLLLEATEERLVGALVGFDAKQDGKEICSVGQIVGIELKNRWHEDSVFRNLVKRTGEIPPITNRQDTRTADLVVGATFKKENEGYDPEVLGMVPPTGTQVFRMEQNLLDQMLALYRKEIFYLGRAYANDILYPMWLKHFGSDDQGVGGAGEAYHIGVFGKTGSGKSGLAKMMLCGYGRHDNMGILVIDPQGEFSRELSGQRVGKQGLPLDEVLKSQGRDVRVFRIHQLQLDDWDTFQELVFSLGFLEELGIPKTSQRNAEKAAEIIRDALDGNVTLHSLASAFEQALDAVAEQSNAEYIYSKQRASDLIKRVDRVKRDDALKDKAQKKWFALSNLFAAGEDRKRLDEVVNELLGDAPGEASCPVIAVDISQQGNQQRGFWSENLQKRILGKLLNVLVRRASNALTTGKSANVLVVLDEAHRHVPSGRLEQNSESERLRSLLRNAIRETRKYGLGWMFISQTLGGLDNEILQQLRILTFGFGLAMGSERDRLRDFVGGDKRALELYESFRDPQSFPRKDLQEFPFMAVGPISPLAFSGRPVFFTMFTDMEEFISENRLKTEDSKPRPPALPSSPPA